MSFPFYNDLCLTNSKSKDKGGRRGPFLRPRHYKRTLQVPSHLCSILSSEKHPEVKVHTGLTKRTQEVFSISTLFVCPGDWRRSTTNVWLKTRDPTVLVCLWCFVTNEFVILLVKRRPKSLFPPGLLRRFRSPEGDRIPATAGRCRTSPTTVFCQPTLVRVSLDRTLEGLYSLRQLPEYPVQIPETKLLYRSTRYLSLWKVVLPRL